MVYGTAVTFAPDTSCLLSVSSDASAVLVPLSKKAAAAVGGGGSRVGASGLPTLLMLLLAVLAALIALALGMARHLAQRGQLQAEQLPSWLPQELARLVLGQL